MEFWADEPRALPWAGMNDALGVSHLSRLPKHNPLISAYIKGTFLR